MSTALTVRLRVADGGPQTLCIAAEASVADFFRQVAETTGQQPVESLKLSSGLPFKWQLHTAKTKTQCVIVLRG